MDEQTPSPPEAPVDSAEADWLPPLILMEEHDHDWKRYVEAVYAVFRADFVLSQPRFAGLWVRHRREPIYDGREAGFWHCIQEGEVEDARLPDLRRCERIRWIRAVIEHADDERVDVWENERGGERNTLIWFDEEYLIVLRHRTRQRDGFRYLMLWTAYGTTEERRRAQLRKERDGWVGGA
ncbi:MAG: hypothetical protein K2W96_25365 [Gemmataceae bacterium]|nr:hypothetical protein [Gemmataceae bacterium]